MKHIFSVLFLLTALSFVISSCEKFLDKPPEGQMGEDEAFQTQADVLAFANGIYTLLGDEEFYGGRQQVLSELLGDQLDGDKFTGDYSEIFKRQSSIFGDIRNGYYNKAYRIIADANLLLNHLDLAGTQKDFVEGQAKFFRAIAHFEAVRLFAQPWGYSPDNSHLGIPIRTVVDLGSVLRSTVKEVYDQILADLLAAESLLPDAAANGKFYTATKWAAKAWLAKVYFQQNDFAKAFQSANEIITSNKFLLDTDYSKRFSKALSTEGILYIADSVGSYTPGKELRNVFRSDFGIPVFVFTSQYYNAATARATDARKASWYSDTLQPDFNVLTKYNKNNFDLPLVHLTEIKLIRAEAGAETGGAGLATAIADMNDILTRAYGSNLFNLPANASAASVIATARTERELEMVGEGNRVQEIKRIGARSNENVDRRGSVWNCNGFILQFPKGENDANTSFVLNPEGGCF